MSTAIETPVVSTLSSQDDNPLSIDDNVSTTEFPAVSTTTRPSELTFDINNTRPQSNSVPSSPSRLLAAAASAVSQTRTCSTSATTTSLFENPAAQLPPTSAVQQAPVVLRKKAVSLVSRWFPSGRSLSTSSLTSRTSSRRSFSTSGSGLHSVAAEVAAPRIVGDLNNRTSTVGNESRRPDTSTTMTMAETRTANTEHNILIAPPSNISINSTNREPKLWSKSWRRMRAASFSTPRDARAGMYGTGNGDSSEEEVVFFESASSLSPPGEHNGEMKDKMKKTISLRKLSDFTKKERGGRGSSRNALQWLSRDCPADVLPHVLSYCGPRMMVHIRRVNKFWRDIIEQESTWKVLCQDLYKWQPDDEEPDSWKEFYTQNPCVPVDFKSVQAVLQTFPEQDMRIWLRPGRYFLAETLRIGNKPQQKISIATMKLPDNIFESPIELVEGHAGNVRTIQSTRKAPSFLKYMMCTSASYNDATLEEGSVGSDAEDNDNSSLVMSVPLRPLRATLVLRTRKQNEPAIRVQHGHFSAVNLNIEHSSYGTDIWNGNAAIQIQPAQPDQEGPPLVLRRDLLPVAKLKGLRVTSQTGRGIVTIDGGQLTCQRVRVHDCAATGIYIGGRGTRALVQETDVLRNGLGSRQNGRRSQGIARGHSGIYLEQGVADILDCNVSNNTLTGITAVSNENSTLTLSDTDLVGNGSFQLEVPSRNARGINMRQNRLESHGTGRVRAPLPPH